MPVDSRSAHMCYVFLTINFSQNVFIAIIPNATTDVSLIIPFLNSLFVTTFFNPRCTAKVITIYAPVIKTRKVIMVVEKLLTAASMCFPFYT